MSRRFFPTSPTDYQQIHADSIAHPEDFWADYAREHFRWHRTWDKVLEYDLHQARVAWFLGARLNITENCIDRHLGDPERIAILWEPNEPDEPGRAISYGELHQEVNRTANMLKKLGVTKGDRVCIYMPMIPELAFAVLACARIGAIHSVVFAGFSARSLEERINDADCKVVLTADGGRRGAKLTELKKITDEALLDCPGVRQVVVYDRCGLDPEMKDGRDLWWHQAIADCSGQCEVEIVDAEDPLFILYTSGSTGRPKGMVHSTAGYMVYTHYTFRNVFQYQAGDTYWCTADIGWITGHSYIIYGPLLAGATTLMFEGAPSYPDWGRFWDVVDKHGVNIFYTAPTAIRALAGCDVNLVKKHRLDSLRVLGTVGEPINHEAWEWYDHYVGKGRCAIVDTWWQTETGGIMISPIPGIGEPKPCYATKPLPGIRPVLLEAESGKELQGEAEGDLCIAFPWPSMARTIYGDHQRYIDTYFSKHPGYYFTGDGCKRDADGDHRITGRVDDVLIVSGHNLGTAEIEDAIDEHPQVKEAAVIGAPHPIKGQGVHAFVQCQDAFEVPANFGDVLVEQVARIVGPIAKPDAIHLIPALPKTRSGKIMRRILRLLASGERQEFGDISTLVNPEVVAEIVAVMDRPDHNLNVAKS